MTVLAGLIIGLTFGGFAGFCVAALFNANGKDDPFFVPEVKSNPPGCAGMNGERS